MSTRSIFALLAVIVLTILGLFVLRNNPKRPLNLFFAATNFCIALWNSSDFVLPFLQQMGPLPLYYDRFSYVGGITFLSVFPNLTIAFLEGTHTAALITKLLPLFYMSTLTFLVLLPTPWIMKDVLFQPHYIEVGGLIYPYFAVVFISIFTVSLISVYISLHQSKGIRKVQVSYFALALSLGLVAAVAAFGLILINPEWPGIIFYVFEMGYSSIVTYAILRHHLMDIEVIIRRSVVFTGLFSIIFGSFSGIAWLFQFLAQQQFPISPTLAAGCAAILVLLLYHPLETLLENTTNQIFFRKRLNLQKALLEMSRGLLVLTEIRQLAKGIVDTLYLKLSLKGAALLVSDENNKDYYLGAASGSLKETLPDNITNDDPLIQSSKETEHILFDALSMTGSDPNAQALREKMKSYGIHLLVPIRVDHTTIGIACLGEKKSEDIFTTGEIQFFQVLSNQVALAIQNAKTYGLVKDQLVREEERTKILSEQLEQSNRIAALGTLASSIAHEIKNPAGIALIAAQRLAKQINDPDSRDKLQTLVYSMERIDAIIRNIIALAKEENVAPLQEVYLHEIIPTVLSMMTISRIRLSKNLAPVPAIMGNSLSLERVFINLIDNAIKAMPDGGDLKLSTYKLTADDGKEIVCAEVSDTGHGIPPENRERIFDPFFSTRHEGAGLGLPTAFRIVKEHGGSIQLHSEEGKGSRFIVRFAPSSTNL